MTTSKTRDHPKMLTKDRKFWLSAFHTSELLLLQAEVGLKIV